MIFWVIDFNDQKSFLKHEKPSDSSKKGLGEYLHPTGIVLSVGLKSEISLFFTSEAEIKIFEMCHMGAHTLPKLFFWKFSTSSKKMECFWYLDPLLVTKTRRVLWSAKFFADHRTLHERTHFFQVKGWPPFVHGGRGGNADFGSFVTHLCLLSANHVGWPRTLKMCPEVSRAEIPRTNTFLAPLDR